MLQNMLLAVGALLLLLPGVSAYAQSVSVETIVRKTNEAAYYQADDGRADVQMTIEDSRGRTRSREFTILRRDNVQSSEGTGQGQKYYVHFRAPADVRGTVLLAWRNPDERDDRWLYLPALDLVKRIAASDERSSFVGSHFFYEDVSGRGTDEDEHTLVETTDNYYVLENTPKEPDLVEFTSFKMWIHKTTFLPVKVEYYKNGDAYRRYEVLEVETIDGLPTVVKAKMTDDERGGHSTLEYTSVDYNIDLPEEIFTERYLRNPPTQYLGK